MARGTVARGVTPAVLALVGLAVPALVGLAVLGAVALGLGAMPGPWGPARARAADEIALAFDPGGEHSCLDAEAFVQVTAYLLILAPSASGGVSGWECEIDYPAHAVLVGAALGGVNPLNVAQPPSFMVGLGGGPLPSAPVVEAARLTFLLTSADPIRFVILPFTPCSLPEYELPVYADGANPNVLRPLTPRVIYGDNVAAGINLPGCSPQPLTWGDIKKLYE